MSKMNLFVALVFLVVFQAWAIADDPIQAIPVQQAQQSELKNIKLSKLRDLFHGYANPTFLADFGKKELWAGKCVSPGDIVSNTVGKKPENEFGAALYARLFYDKVLGDEFHFLKRTDANEPEHFYATKLADIFASLKDAVSQARGANSEATVARDDRELGGVLWFSVHVSRYSSYYPDDFNVSGHLLRKNDTLLGAGKQLLLEKRFLYRFLHNDKWTWNHLDQMLKYVREQLGKKDDVEGTHYCFYDVRRHLEKDEPTEAAAP